MAIIDELSLRPGEVSRSLGVLLTAEGQGLQGVGVQVWGEALVSGLVQPLTARAKPWSARLAPWEQNGWEHSLEEQPEQACWSTELRSVRLHARPPSPRLAFTRARENLGHAVWVCVELKGLKPGRAALSLCVRACSEPTAEAVTREVTLSVRARDCSYGMLQVEWPLWSRAILGHWRRCVHLWAQALTRWTGLPHVAMVRVVGPRPWGPAWVVLGADGLKGEARWGQLLEWLEAGFVQSLSLRPLVGANGRETGADFGIEWEFHKKFGSGPVRGQFWVAERLCMPHGARPALEALGALCGAERWGVEGRVWPYGEERFRPEGEPEEGPSSDAQDRAASLRGNRRGSARRCEPVGESSRNPGLLRR